MIGLGGVGLSCVMGAVLAGARRIVGVDVSRAKLDLAGTLGATHWVQADPANPDARRSRASAQAAGDGGPDFVFEAIGLPATIGQAIAALPPGGTAVLVGLTKFGQTAAFEAFPFVDGGRRILGSNYGSAVAAVDFPRYAEAYLAGRLPVDRLIDRRLPLADLEDAFDRLRAGEAARQVVVFEDVSRPRRASSGRPAASRPRTRARRAAPARARARTAGSRRRPRTPVGDRRLPERRRRRLDRAAADQELVRLGGVLVGVERVPAVREQVAVLRGVRR